MVDRILWNLDNSSATGLIFANFKKAFDLVDHEIKIQKLQIYGLGVNSLKLLRLYLSDRKQRTATIGSQSLGPPTRSTTGFRPCSAALSYLYQ